MTRGILLQSGSQIPPNIGDAAQDLDLIDRRNQKRLRLTHGQISGGVAEVVETEVA